MAFTLLTVGVIWLMWVVTLNARVLPCRPKRELEISSRCASMGCRKQQWYTTLSSVLDLRKQPTLIQSVMLTCRNLDV